ncbi:hypothetical protein [Hyphomicrobium sp. 2TAF46]
MLSSFAGVYADKLILKRASTRPIDNCCVAVVRPHDLLHEIET